MTDRGTLFSAAMVRALRDGRKTQTRRLASSPLAEVRVGDRLWVREAWRTETGDHDPVRASDVDRTVRLLFDADAEWGDNKTVGRRRASMHMPRWASRLTLIVTDVRRQALQDISEVDCLAEGPKVRGWAEFFGGSSLDGVMVHTAEEHVFATPRCWYRLLWGSLHDKPGERWDDNPEVVALTFEVRPGNIDHV